MLKGRPAFLKTMPPIPNINPDYTYDPTDITLFDGSRVKRDSPLGQAMASNFPTQAASRQAAPTRAGQQDADYYLPMNKDLTSNYAASGVNAITKLNAFLEGDRTSTIRKDKQGLTIAHQAQPGQTIRFYDNDGQTGLARVTETPQRINQEIFTENLPDSASVEMPPNREALIKLGLTEGQNEAGIRRTLFGETGNRGIGGSGYVIPYELIPNTSLNISQLPATQQQRITEQQDQPNYPVTDGQGYVGYKDHYLERRSNPTAANQGEMPMLSGADQYDPVITGWLNANIVNEDSKHLTPAAIATRGARKSRYEDGQWVERPITSSIQNLKPDFNQQTFDQALAMGNDLSRFYQPGVTQSMLDADLPRTNNLLTEDQAIRQINAEQQNQLTSRNLESIEVYNKPQDLRPPSSARGADNYNLAYKYTNTSDLLNLNDGYNQQWGEQIPKHYSDYAGGPIQYNDAGVAIGFGDRNLNPITPLARGARNYLPISETYTSAPQHTYQEQRNVIPLQPELISSPLEQQQLRDNLPPEPSPIGRGTMSGYPVQTTGLTLGVMPEVNRAIEPSETLKRFARYDFADDGAAEMAAKSLTPDDYKLIAKSNLTPEQVISNSDTGGFDAREYLNEAIDTERRSSPPTIPNAYLQHVNERGDLLINPETNKPHITPYTPSDNLNQRSDELSRVLIQQGDRMYPYVGVASEPLMSEGYTRNDSGDLIQKVSDVELVRDPTLLPDALNRIQQLKEEARILSGNVQRQGSTDPKSYLDKHIEVTNQAKHLEDSYNALTAIDPDMNIDSQSFKVGVEMQQGQNADKIATLLRNNGIDPVMEGPEITGRGDLPIRQQAELGRDIRRSLLPGVDQAITSADPEMDQLVKQWETQRNQRRLNEVVGPVVDDKQVAINRLSSAIENANYQGEPVRQNLNFDPNDFDILSETVHPLDRVPDRIPVSNFQSQMARANPGFTFTPSNSDPVYTGFERAPAGKMVHAAYLGEMLDPIPQQYAAATPGFEFNPNSSSPEYMGQQRPVRGNMSYVPQMVQEVAPAGGMNRKALIGGGILGALTLGGLAYQNAKRQQDEQDAYEMQMRQMTGWR